MKPEVTTVHQRTHTVVLNKAEIMSALREWFAGEQDLSLVDSHVSAEVTFDATSGTATVTVVEDFLKMPRVLEDAEKLPRNLRAAR